MTDEELKNLLERLMLHSDVDAQIAASAIRQLMRERDEAHRDGQRDMQLRALAVANNAGIFARIMELEITHQPPF